MTVLGKDHPPWLKLTLRTAMCARSRQAFAGAALVMVLALVLALMLAALAVHSSYRVA